MRTLIYARFSSRLQNAKSSADQIADCRAYALAQGWEIVGAYNDDEIRGGAGIDARPGLNTLLERAERGDADQVLAESTDRIARHEGDSFSVRERLAYAGVRLFTLMQGEIDDIRGTLQGLFDAKFSRDLGARVRRGQRGTVADGRSPAGIAFGYRQANRIDERGRVIRGLRAIHPDHAAIVLRIFTEYADGESTRAIAARLNAEGLKGPRGGAWRASTIAGDRKRRDGMLQNQLYAGRIVHQRTSKVVDPRSRRSRIRPKDESEWIVQDAPHLRIVPEDLWDKVQAMRTRFATSRPEQARRPKHMLSGLAVCGVCGGGWTVIGRGRWGCSRWRDGRGCSNNRTIITDRLESRVLDGLTGQLLDPDYVSIWVREYHRTAATDAAASSAERTRLERRSAELARHVERWVQAIAAGADLDEIRAAIAGAREERGAIDEALAALAAANVVTFHPNIADRYRDQVTHLNKALADPSTRAEAMPIIRSLVDRITVSPNPEGRGTTIDVVGRLASILAVATGAELPAMYANIGAGSRTRLLPYTELKVTV